ncbi:EVA1C protein, partial [Acromyrmex charruanus]
MTLKCPPGTTILVEHAQYGRTGMHGISKCNSSVPLMITGDKPTNHTCIWPQSVQHSLLQMVVGVCQKKRQCKFNTDPKTFQGDPCPGLRKYIEVAYKCRPCADKDLIRILSGSDKDLIRSLSGSDETIRMRIQLLCCVT